MFEYVLPAAITALSAVLIAIIENKAKQDRKLAAEDREKTKCEFKKLDERSELRAEESRLSMAMQHANCKLGVVTAKAVTNQHVNGDVEDAIHDAELAQKDYEKFHSKIASNILAQ
jgi:hypothetical protein